MTQNEEFEFLRAVATREQQDEREQPAGDEVDERREHGQPLRDGSADATCTNSVVRLEGGWWESHAYG